MKVPSEREPVRFSPDAAATSAHPARRADASNSGADREGSGSHPQGRRDPVATSTPRSGATIVGPDRVAWSDQQIREHLSLPATSVHVAYVRETPAGYFDARWSCAT